MSIDACSVPVGAEKPRTRTLIAFATSLRERLDLRLQRHATGTENAETLYPARLGVRQRFADGDDPPCTWLFRMSTISGGQPF
ncbi:hypothetical protein [Variovorax sp. LT1R16]|uniref:hypothetical protein n=1 Tax=Variovorax sp. LT1R16 TaxID=3443728 RepID=UPI003F485039